MQKPLPVPTNTELNNKTETEWVLADFFFPGRVQPIGSALVNPTK